MDGIEHVSGLVEHWAYVVDVLVLCRPRGLFLFIVGWCRQGRRYVAFTDHCQLASRVACGYGCVGHDQGSEMRDEILDVEGWICVVLLLCR